MYGKYKANNVRCKLLVCNKANLRTDIKINYFNNNMLIYSNYSKVTIDDEQLKILEDFEKPFEKFTGSLSALPEDFKVAVCQRLYYVSKHICDYCSNAQMQE